MEVYIEYAFIENFCVDCALLYLALKCVKLPVKKLRLVISATMGAVFAIIYPFLSVLFVLSTLLKALVPLLLCAICYDGKIFTACCGGKIAKKKNSYALFSLSFYLLSFAFAGGVYGFCAVFSVEYAFGEGIFTKVPVGLIFAFSVSVFALCKSFVKRIYARKEELRFIYPCEIHANGKKVKADGFADSGNLAQKDGSPICFLAPEVFFSLFGEEVFSLGYEEMAISTVSGEKKIKLFKIDEIKIYCGKIPNIIKKPYCSPSYLFRAREYKILLGAWALNGEKTNESEV